MVIQVPLQVFGTALGVGTFWEKNYVYSRRYLNEIRLSKRRPNLRKELICRYRERGIAFGGLEIMGGLLTNEIYGNEGEIEQGGKQTMS